MYAIGYYTWCCRVWVYIGLYRYVWQNIKQINFVAVVVVAAAVVGRLASQILQQQWR